MKKILFAAVLLIPVFLTLISCNSTKEHNLYNGKDLSNWSVFLKDPQANPDSVFYIKDGILNVAGQPFGYLRSEKNYSNYKLHLEYRWVKEPANSGIFLHAAAEDKIWPLCYECQLYASKAGDIILMGLGMGMTVKDSTYLVVPAEKASLVMPKFEESSEKPAGEWNVVDITCDNDNIEVIINGVLQNQGTRLTTSSGFICLQSEGGPMQYRNIKLDPINKTAKEY